MLEKANATTHNNNSIGSDMDVVNTTGFTSNTLVSEEEDDYYNNDKIDLRSKREEYSNAIFEISQDEDPATEITDKELISQIQDRHLEEKNILKTLDRRMMPLFCLFYFVDFLDRANIGNATLGGISEDLHLTPKQLSTAISAFYITYILFEVPSNVVLKRTSAVTWLSFIMLVWGVMTLVMAFAKNFKSLLACRLLLGAAESGYIPGILYLMSKVYRPREFGLRVAFLLCMSSISGIVSGPLAYGTSFLEGRRGLHGWQYLFILEGVPTICLSVISYFYLFDDINNVPWLTDTQKALHKHYTKSPTKEASITAKSFIKACFNWKTCLFSVVYFLNAINVVSNQVFTPTIIDGFGFPVLTSQLLCAPPNVISLIMILIGGYTADKYTNKRGYLTVTGFSTAAFGYMLLIILENRWARYGSLFIISGGLGLLGKSGFENLKGWISLLTVLSFILAPVVVGWSAINFPSLEIRVVAVAVVVMIGNSGGIISSYLYPLFDKPHYYFGNIFNLACAILGAVSSGLTSYLLYRQNLKKDSQFQKFGEESGETEEKTEEFRYYY